MADVLFIDLERARKYCDRFNHWLLAEPKGGWRIVETRARAVEVAGPIRISVMDLAASRDEVEATAWHGDLMRCMSDMSRLLGEARERDDRRSGRAVAQ
jgi:hypothetical protein